MRERDEAKKSWLERYLKGELLAQLQSDKHDMQAHIDSQSSDFDKLTRLVTKLSD
jgi:hypothetical protein